MLYMFCKSTWTFNRGAFLCQCFKMRHDATQVFFTASVVANVVSERARGDPLIRELRKTAPSLGPAYLSDPSRFFSEPCKV